MLFIINYTALSSSGNIFLSDFYEGDKKIELTFDESPEVSGNFNNAEISQGTLILTNKITAPYVKIEGDNPMMIIKINLNNVSTKIRKKTLKQLAHFITKQDSPIVLFGNFGAPSWNRYLQKFTLQTRLNVKNKILYTNNTVYKYFTLPNFYILGFNNMGIDNIKISDKPEQSIKFDILF